MSVKKNCTNVRCSACDLQIIYGRIIEGEPFCERCFNEMVHGPSVDMEDLIEQEEKKEFEEWIESIEKKCKPRDKLDLQRVKLKEKARDELDSKIRIGSHN